jgi:hypothetical protein
MTPQQSTEDDFIDNTQYRDKLYWNKYVYRVTVNLPGATMCHDARNAENFWKSCFELQWFSESRKDYVEKNKVKYLQYYNWLKNSAKNTDCKFRTESGYVSIFTNDGALVKEFRNAIPDSQCTKAVVSKHSEIKLFRTQPKHKYRIYLRSLRVDTEDYHALVDFLREHSDQFNISPAFHHHAIRYEQYKWRHKWLSSSYFIDYDQQSLESWLDLKFGEMLGKRYELRKYDEDLLK